MNEYKLIVFDLDGTLLNNRMKISDYSKIKINKLIKNGIKCAIISGRNLTDIKEIIKNIQFCYIGALNGALIYNNETFKVEKESFINKKIVNDILTDMEINNYVKDFYTNDNVIITGYAKNKFARSYQEKLRPDIIKSDLQNKNIYEIDVIGENDSESKRVYNYLNKKYNKLISIKNGGYNFIILNNKKVSKGNTLNYISKKLKIDLKQTIVVGDSESDLTMFNKNCYKIAMKNSNKELFDCADEITSLNNNEDGAIKAILSLFK